MSGFNQFILFGNVGNDPELKYLQSGAAAVSISLATSRRKKDDAGEWQEKTTWHRVKFFGNQAEVIGQHVKKGDKFFCEGRIDYWEVQGERGKLNVADLIGEHFEFGGRGRSSEVADPAPRPGSTARERAREAVHGGAEVGAPAAGAATGQQRPFDEPFDDDIPF